MGTLTKRKDSKGRIRYRAQVQIKGYPAQSKTLGSQKLAEKWIKETEDLIRSGRHAAVSEAEKHTVADMIDRYIDEQVPNLRSGHNVKRELEWFRREIGKHSLVSLTSALIVECKTKLQREESTRGKRSPATVNRYLAALSSCCGVASKEWMWIEDNPSRNVSKLREDNKRNRFLSDAELPLLLQACKDISFPLYLAVVLSLSTGARRMNIWSLRWQDIELTPGKESVRFEHTKNNQPLMLPLTGTVLELLHEYQRTCRTDTDLLFPSKVDAQRPFDFKAGFQKALKIAEIQNFRWHDLRHSVASYLAQHGVSLLKIAEILGHSSVQMSQRYSHLRIEDLRQDLSRVTGKL